MRDTAGTLNEAYQLIEAGNLAQARLRLQPLLTSDSENPDVWWLYAHAVEDSAEGQRALQRVVALSPSYPGAADLVAKAPATAPEKPAVKPLTPLRPLAPLPPDLPEPAKQIDNAASDDDFDNIDDEDFGSTDEEAPRRRSPLMLVAVVLLALVVIAILALLLSQSGTPAGQATPTSIVAQNVTNEPITPTTGMILMPTEELIPTENVLITEEPAATVEVVVTEEPAMTEEMVMTEEPSPTSESIAPQPTDEIIPAETAEVIPTLDSQSASTTDLTGLSEALSAFSVSASDLQIKQTTLGATALVDGCEIPGPNAGTLIASLIDSMAKFEGYGEDVEAIGVSVADCENGSTPRIVAVAITDAESYRTGMIDAREFQRRWQPVDEE